GVSTSSPTTFRFPDFPDASPSSCLYIAFSAAASCATTSPAAVNGVALQPASHAASPRSYAANQPSAAALTSVVTSGTTTVGADGLADGMSPSSRGRSVTSFSRCNRRGPSPTVGCPRFSGFLFAPAPPAAAAAFCIAFACAPVADVSCSLLSPGVVKMCGSTPNVPHARSSRWNCQSRYTLPFALLITDGGGGNGAADITLSIAAVSNARRPDPRTIPTRSTLPSPLTTISSCVHSSSFAYAESWRASMSDRNPSVNSLWICRCIAVMYAANGDA